MSFRGVVSSPPRDIARARTIGKKERRNRTHTNAQKGKHRNRPSRTLMPCEYGPAAAGALSVAINSCARTITEDAFGERLVGRCGGECARNHVASLLGSRVGFFFFKFFRQKSQDETLDTSAKFQTKKKRLLLHFAQKKNQKNGRCVPQRREYSFFFNCSL